MIAQADCFQIPLASKSVHCVVTSPPYWGLRKYAGEQGTEPLGLEPTPERHIERTVTWAREVWRVLRLDGVFWLNYGDCYHGSGGENGNLGLGVDTSEAHGLYRANPRKNKGNLPGHEVSRQMRGGNLALMPHRVALALQADGWIVRQDLVWSKSNPMPESVHGWSFNSEGDLRRGSWRHTRAHEYVFMLVKGMGYWSDQEAVREKTDSAMSWEEYARKTAPGATWRSGGMELNAFEYKTDGGQSHPAGRNPRSVLHVPTAPYKGAHYATYPPALIAPLILATCPRWCCPVCGQGWAPVVERVPTGETQKMADGWDTGEGAHGTVHRNGRETGETGKNVLASSVLGYRFTCDHPHTQAEARPGIVFDPFVGSGTSVMVARQLGRRGIGIDISQPYLREQAQKRIMAVPTGKWAKQLEKLQTPTLF